MAGQPAALVPVIGYVRVSMAREDMISPAIQRTAISGWADRSGRVVVAWIEDLDATGRNFRRKVMTGIARIEGGEAREIAVYRYDRWGRNAADAMANIVRVERAGGAVVSATEPLDPETAIGRYNRTNSLALAEMQSDIIGENWRAALSSRVQRGLPATGYPRFGYVRKGRIPRDDAAHLYRVDRADPVERYEPDPVTGPVLAELYERFNSGTGTTRLLRYLNGSGIPSMRGGPWSIQTLASVLDSGFGAGLLKVHDIRCPCRQPSRCPRVTFVPGTQEPVIGPETWQAYRDRRAKLRDVPPRSRVAAYPLTSLVFCGSCGGPCIACTANGQRGYAYRCNRWVQHHGCGGVWVRRSLVEQAVLDRLAEWLEGEALEVTPARKRAQAGAESAERRLRARLAKADKELVNLVRLQAQDSSTPAAVYEQAKAAVLAERAEAEAQLAAAARARERAGTDYRPLVTGLLANWEFFTPARKRDTLARVIARVVVTRTGYRTPADIRVVPVWEDGELSLGENVE